MPGLLERMYGFEQRPMASADTLPSDLAAAAGLRALDQGEISADEVDLLVFAAVSEDMEEPATSHIVAEKLGVTAPVFDVKNACNGMLNSIHIADALVRDGQYDRVLLVSGELGTRTSVEGISDRRELNLRLPAFTTCDIGAAVLLEASPRPGVMGSKFTANSSGWRAATLPNPYFAPAEPARPQIDSAALVDSFAGMTSQAERALHDLGYKIDDLDLACVHQASAAFTNTFCRALGIPEDKIVRTFSRYGNATTASLPLQLAEASEQGRLRPGGLVALFGLASGASGGLVLLRW
ncbi:3-oxoacyl-[acyl-carrier-protein] synthase III C-terminal domain-containing protein [Streptomyces sp. NPDC094032]|uniref:3-oxoacyl-ACP synthase III family protein n=1 Tax=Streptomyces sp. NPDC094032 TaxID=3155308 RepID=UPI00332F3A7B